VSDAQVTKGPSMELCAVAGGYVRGMAFGFVVRRARLGMPSALK